MGSDGSCRECVNTLLSTYSITPRWSPCHRAPSPFLTAPRSRVNDPRDKEREKVSKTRRGGLLSFRIILLIGFIYLSVMKELLLINTIIISICTRVDVMRHVKSTSRGFLYARPTVIAYVARRMRQQRQQRQQRRRSGPCSVARALVHFQAQGRLRGQRAQGLARSLAPSASSLKGHSAQRPSNRERAPAPPTQGQAERESERAARVASQGLAAVVTVAAAAAVGSL